MTIPKPKRSMKIVIKIISRGLVKNFSLLILFILSGMKGMKRMKRVFIVFFSQMRRVSLNAEEKKRLKFFSSLSSLSSLLMKSVIVASVFDFGIAEVYEQADLQI